MVVFLLFFFYQYIIKCSFKKKNSIFLYFRYMDIYIDGATTNNQNKDKRRGGIGVFFGDNDIRNVSLEILNNPTNLNTMSFEPLL